jgi:CheY-like chemotaxis protein
MKPEGVMVVRGNLATTTVLLVDDEPPQLELRAQVLEMCGFCVLTPCGPVEAMALISGTTERIDVAILDYHMPIMNGCVLADLLRSHCPGLKVILHSGAVDIPRREIRSVDAFVPKSDGVDTLVGSVIEFANACTGPTRLRMAGTQSYCD